MENRTNLFSFCLNVVATHVWTSNWSPQNFRLGVVNIGMLELKIRKTSALGQNSSHLKRLRIKPFFLPSVTRISKTLSTANHDQLEPHNGGNRH